MSTQEIQLKMHDVNYIKKILTWVYFFTSPRYNSSWFVQLWIASLSHIVYIACMFIWRMWSPDFPDKRYLQFLLLYCWFLTYSWKCSIILHLKSSLYFLCSSIYLIILHLLTSMLFQERFLTNLSLLNLPPPLSPLNTHRVWLASALVFPWHWSPRGYQQSARC